MRTRWLIGLLAAMVAAWTVQGADWPQWNGPTGNGISPEKGLLKTWPKAGPALTWTFEDGGTGYTAPAVVGGFVYLAGARKNDEYVICLDDKGKEKWASKIGPVWDFAGNNWSRGPNATPAVNGDSLVMLGSQGILVCLDLATGKEHWRKDLPKAMGAQVNPIGGNQVNMGWGFSWSPLIDGNQVIITPGGPQGLVAALDKKTGNVLWQSKGAPDQATYATPMLTKIDGVKQVVAMTQDGAVGVDAANGNVLWNHKRANPWPDVVCTSPVIQGNKVYLTTGYSGGCELLELTQTGGKFSVKSVYEQKAIGNKQGGVVLIDNYLYGAHENRDWQCQDFATGDNKWNSGRRGLGVGSVIYADGMLYCLGEDKGEAALLQASPTAYKELGRFKLPMESTLRKPNGRVWTHPVISNGILYLRDQELVFAYKIK